MPEIVEDGVTGSLVGASDPLALALVTTAHVDEGPRRTTLSDAGARMIEPFTVQRQADAHIICYEELLAGWDQGREVGRRDKIAARR